MVQAVSVVLAKRALARADVAVVVIDATEGAGDREAANERSRGKRLRHRPRREQVGPMRAAEDFAKKFDDKLDSTRFSIRADRPDVALTGDHVGSSKSWTASRARCAK
jgi:hypothetical protein